MMENTQEAIALPSDDQEFGLLLAPAATAAQPRNDSELESVVIRLFDQFQGRVLSYILNCGLPFHDAEDVVQETFLALYRHLELGRPRANLNGWLFRVAHNLALKRRRSSLPAGLDRDQHHVLTQQAAPDSNPEAHFAFNQMHQR